MKPLLLSLTVAAMAAAQTPPGAVGGPVLGAVFDAGTGTVRSLAGIPASATLSAPLDSGPAMDHAVSAAEGYAVGTEAAGGAAVLVSAAGRQELPGIPPHASQVIVSPQGAAAAFYFPENRTVYRVNGLPAAPQALPPVITDGQPAILALSDDGANLLTVERETRRVGSVFLYRDNRPRPALARGASIVAAAFFPASANALIAEDARVLLVGPGFGPQPVADAQDGLAGIVAVVASADGSRAIIAMRSGQVAVRDLRTNSQSSVSCLCVPTTLARLHGNSVFRLNDPGAGPLWLLDADAPDPRIFFVAGSQQ